ncbi:hypothetical protein ACH5RR_001843 [Cinchona calisaya]|uniref:non-specific serine/threonine protein kinase n=1 Tax=Cinchona calisaya TaxID=153742 RepID=A0ABD3B4J6_9GENT
MEKGCFLFVALFTANCLALSLASTPAQNVTTDVSALLEFKNLIPSDPFSNLANWSSTNFVCNWQGISCNLQNQRVMALNLSNLSLTGTIAPHLGNLTFLTSLDLSFNNFSGFIPSELANLQQLQLLHLNNNSFSGAIPLSLSNISNLEGLNLEYNFLEGSIPQGIGNLSNLKTLTLGHNQLTGSLPYGIFNMSFLEEIDLTENSLSGSLPLDICNYRSKVKKLYLSMNQIQGAIPQFIYKCRDLEHLSLSYNQLLGTIPRTLGYLSKLKDLSIGANTFEGGIPLEIGNLTNLEQLDMKSSSLTGRIPLSIFNISSLRMIDFSNNSLSGSFPAGMSYNLPALEQLYLYTNHFNGSIPSFIWECKNLVVLRLAENNFTGGISKSIGNLTSLKGLDLNDNELTGEIPAEIGNNANIERLFLGYNNLSGHVHPGLFNMSSLYILVLDSNHFSGPLPSSMWSTLPNIQQIYLSTNKFSGLLPSSISNASKLTMLAMLQNSFTGPIPNTLGNLRFLRRLFLGGNNFSRESGTQELTFLSALTNCRELEVMELSLNQFNGFLPTSIGNFSASLQLFNAFGSKIVGTIPSEIGNLSSLQSINLDSNEFTGVIPPTLGKLSRVDRIYLENNKLQGYIPKELCQLKNLGDLYLNDNMLQGSIPDCLGDLKSLGRVFLQSNNLSSMIPMSLWNLNTLLGLNLSYNSLTGQLPPAVQNLRVIIQLDLSWNQLSGDIPSTLSSAQSLVYLSLAQNRFEGHIPESLGNIMSLEDLDLSHNNLLGRIPKSFEKLLYMKHFDVSFNRLEGEIPNGGPFVNFTAQSFQQNYALCGLARLHFPPCKKETFSKSSPEKVLRYTLPPIALGILIVLIIYLWLRRKRRIGLPHNDISVPHPWRKFSYQELLNATDSFSTNNLLGTGSYGSVFRGIFADGSNIAVKVFHLQSGEGNKTFDSECEVLASIRHRNIIRILSCCSNEDFKALILEYMPNGSLESWLYSGNYVLDMLQRLNIAIDVASALEYLHHDQTPPTVHCDLKPSNILIDRDMMARICDFSISKLFSEREVMVQTKTLATIGYMAPEYGTQGIVSASCDVYSFGIVLLEMFTIKKPTDEIFGEELNLKDWIIQSLQTNSISEVVDRNLIRQEDGQLYGKQEFLANILRLGLDCLVDSPQERINMRDTVIRLKKMKAALLS